MRSHGKTGIMAGKLGRWWRKASASSAFVSAGTVGGAVALTVPAILLFSHSAAVESALAAAVADPAAIMAARSPGPRAAGALTQTKLRYAGPRAPVERVLGGDRTRPAGAAPAPGPDATTTGALPVVPANAFGDPVAADAPGVFGTSPGLTPVGGVPVSGFVPGVGGGGGGGDGGTGTTPPTTPVDPPVTAVPEPATWLMTIMGFFTIGLGLRRRRAAPAPAAPAPDATAR